MPASPSSAAAPEVERARLPRLGVGVAYVSGLAPLLDAVDFVEVEPQTLWLQDASGALRRDEDALASIAALPLPKLVHGVGDPVGTARGSDGAQLELFARTARDLDAVWASEHLAFNRSRAGGRERHTGFLLPPRQTEAGAAACARTIRAAARRVGRPFLVETGVSYLRPRSDELSDGAFLRAVCERADCGLVLDLHNLWCNEENGRQRVADVLAELPLERVVEIHVAGGMQRGGYRLDAHSGATPEPVLALARAWVPRMEGLRAITFEVLASWLPALGLDGARREVERLRELWALAPEPGKAVAPPRSGTAPVRAAPDRAPDDVLAWEDALGALVAGGEARGRLAEELRADPGVALLRGLVGDLRASMLARATPYATRLLLLALGSTATRELIGRFAATRRPEAFASREGAAFLDFLARLRPDVPYLDDVLAYERALLRAAERGEATAAAFAHDPVALLRALAAGRLPEPPARRGGWRVAVTV